MDFGHNLVAQHDPCVHPSSFFVVDLDQLKSILKVDGIQDRNVVVVPITGAIMSHFFVKYLYAQVTSSQKMIFLNRNRKYCNPKLLLFVSVVQNT